MLTIQVVMSEVFDETTNEYITETFDLDLEHSLVSVSKWESKYKKAFLGKAEKTPEEVLGYVEAMIINPEFSPEVISRLSKENFDEINAYISDPMSATVLRDSNSRSSRDVVTSEVIYYSMIALNIPDRFETWHLNRLLTLIRVCNMKNSPPKKMSQQEIAEHNRKLNAKRKAELGTTG